MLKCMEARDSVQDGKVGQEEQFRENVLKDHETFKDFVLSGDDGQNDSMKRMNCIEIAQKHNVIFTQNPSNEDSAAQNNLQNPNDIS